MTAPTEATGSAGTAEAVVERTPEDGRLLVRPPTLVRRRPVLTFVGALALLCLVLAGIGRSGVAAPQVRMRYHGGLGDGSTVCGSTYSLVNDGLRPVEVEAVTGGLRVVLVELDPAASAEERMFPDPDDMATFAPFTMAGGTGREVGVEVPCASDEPEPREPVVHVRSADLGLRREIRPT